MSMLITFGMRPMNFSHLSQPGKTRDQRQKQDQAARGVKAGVHRGCLIRVPSRT